MKHAICGRRQKIRNQEWIPIQQLRRGTNWVYHNNCPPAAWALGCWHLETWPNGLAFPERRVSGRRPRQLEWIFWNLHWPFGDNTTLWYKNNLDWSYLYNYKLATQNTLANPMKYEKGYVPDSNAARTAGHLDQTGQKVHQVTLNLAGKVQRLCIMTLRLRYHGLCLHKHAPHKVVRGYDLCVQPKFQQIVPVKFQWFPPCAPWSWRMSHQAHSYKASPG